MYMTFSICQFNQVWCWDVDQMLFFTLEKHKKCWSLRGSAPNPVGGAHSAPLNPWPLAGFKPILCLVVFFIGLKWMRISLSPLFQMKIYTHRTKNDLTAWAPIRLEGHNKIWGPGIDLCTPWKFFSLRPCLCGCHFCNYTMFTVFWKWFQISKNYLLSPRLLYLSRHSLHCYVIIISVTDEIGANLIGVQLMNNYRLIFGVKNEYYATLFSQIIHSFFCSRPPQK